MIETLPNNSNYVLDVRTYHLPSLQKASAFLQAYFEGEARVKISRMPVKKTILTNNKAHHIHKLSQESFEVRRMSWVFTFAPEKHSGEFSSKWEQFRKELPMIAWKIAPGVGFRFR